jgi:hypothetical protein
VAGVDEEYHFPQVGTITRTTQQKIEEIQQHESNETYSGRLPQKRKRESNADNSEVNNSDEYVYRHCYQFAVGLFGLTAYDCLQENDSGNQLLNTVRRLLVAWQDPVDCQTDEKKRFLVQQMQPLVYSSEEPPIIISSQSQSSNQSTTLRVKTSIHCGTIETGSSLTPASFNSMEQRLIPNPKNLEIEITQAIKEGKRYLQEKTAK